MDKHPESMPVEQTELSSEVLQPDVHDAAQHIGSMVVSNEHLRDHQVEALESVIQTFKEGEKRCYIQMPTGSGKTVVFVELCRMLGEMRREDTTLRSLVLVPTKDLSSQAQGSVDEKTGKRKGFLGFAPDIESGYMHSEVSQDEKLQILQNSDVVITTYDTFRNLIEQYEKISDKTPETMKAEHDKCVENFYTSAARLEFTRKLAAEKRREFYAAEQLRKLILKTEELALSDNKKQRKLITPERLSAIDKLKKIYDGSRKETFVRDESIVNYPKNFTETIIKTLGDFIPEDTKISFQAVQKNKKLDEWQKSLIHTYRNITSGNKVSIDKIFDREHLRELAYSRRAAQYHKRGMASAIRRAKACEFEQALQEQMNSFALIVCDEAHRAIGTKTWDSIDSFANKNNTALFGLTATDKYATRSVASYFGKKAYDLTPHEAIERKITNPLQVYVYDTKITVGDLSFDVSGDFESESIRSLRHNKERNAAAVHFARQLTEQGYSGVISAMAGNNAEHADILADMINAETVLINGKLRPLRAAAIKGEQPSDYRETIYEMFEAGEIDWLVSVDVLREGWDSDKAKALINLRPTRSPLLARQRLGRVTRTHEGAETSVVIDFYDRLKTARYNKAIPPVLATDLFEISKEEQGYVYGKQAAHSDGVHINDPHGNPLGGELPTHFMWHESLMKNMPVLASSGEVADSNVLKSKGWVTAARLLELYKGYFPETLMLDAIDEDKESAIETHFARRPRTGQLEYVFNTAQIERVFSNSPTVNPEKLWLDGDGNKWITPEGCVRLFKKIEPGLTAETIEDRIRESTKIPYRVAKIMLRGHIDEQTAYGYTLLYQMEDILKHKNDILRKES